MSEPGGGSSVRHRKPATGAGSSSSSSGAGTEGGSDGRVRETAEYNTVLFYLHVARLSSPNTSRPLVTLGLVSICMVDTRPSSALSLFCAILPIGTYFGTLGRVFDGASLSPAFRSLLLHQKKKKKNSPNRPLIQRITRPLLLLPLSSSLTSFSSFISVPPSLNPTTPINFNPTTPINCLLSNMSLPMLLPPTLLNNLC
ncbi:hypothetical protein VP01_915g10 [Puccinia sorghi]|uniref:Uncharacterized protein n=1 Tax=Puccinia sorghi TaxID=27349 RepID=A0A0L6U9K9_9BASI|nr:hypothetical protein VP01_915g10 [Puccinia sorghi]